LTAAEQGRLRAEDAGLTRQCCERFYLEFYPWELQTEKVYCFGDGAQIADMVDLVGIWHLSPEGDLNWPVPGAFYRCKNHQADGTCGIYDSRPTMCSKFPYGRVCTFGPCDMQDTCDRCCSPEGQVATLEAQIAGLVRRVAVFVEMETRATPEQEERVRYMVDAQRDMLQRARRLLAEVREAERAKGDLA